MKRIRLAALILTTLSVPLCAQTSARSYLGFDRNDYPGDTNLKDLRKTFSYTGYWLNNPPGSTANTWTGHRAAVEAAGFGFLVLFNGRLYAELKSVANAQRLGQSDGQAAASAARREEFPSGAIIFLDQEQGGRMLPEQKAYIYSWVDSVTASGFHAGVYCSGIPAADDAHVVTANDIEQSAASRRIAYWATNDACPPSPGCAFPQNPPRPGQSGIRFAEVWQYAQSPRRADVAAQCRNYNRDGNCYPPDIPISQGLHLDLNSATSADPSQGRVH